MPRIHWSSEEGKRNHTILWWSKKPETSPTAINSVSCVLWNVRSICNKTDEVMQALDDANIDIGFITETWLEEHSGLTTHIIKGYGFNICRTDRGSRGGGIAVIYRNIVCKEVVFPHYVSSSINSFEYHAIQLTSTQEKYCIICLYRKLEVLVR